MNSVLNSMLAKYDIKNTIDEINAIKEIIQEIVICGLSRGGFFNEAAFYGGTALRIFYGLNRFSEDLDFALLKPNRDFDLSKYFPFIEKEVKAYGLNLDIITKEKTKDSNIFSAFLKGDTKEHIFIFFPNENMKNMTSLKNIKIKFEVDVNPSSGATYEFKYKLLPSPHQVRLYDEPSQFAGKIHALLCRNWSRVKGRDLYDYLFYLSRNARVNIVHLKAKLIDSGYMADNTELTLPVLVSFLEQRFREIDYTQAKDDVRPFLKDTDSLNMWDADFFVSATRQYLQICD